MRLLAGGGAVVKARRGLLDIEEDEEEEEVIAAVDRSAREVVSADDVLILRRIIYRLFLCFFCLQLLFMYSPNLFPDDCFKSKEFMIVCGVHDQMNSFASFPPPQLRC